MWRNTVAIHSVLKKKIQNSIFNQLLIKKIKSTKKILKKKHKKMKKQKKTLLGKKSKNKMKRN
jgi:hypothetical protein